METNFKDDIVIHLKNNISATYHEYQLDNKSLYELAELVYVAYCTNKRKLVKADFSPELLTLLEDKEITANFIQLFYDKIYHKVSYYVHAKTNDMSLNNTNYSITCDNVVRPVGPNSATFENNPALDEEVNNGLLKELSI